MQCAVWPSCCRCRETGDVYACLGCCQPQFVRQARLCGLCGDWGAATSIEGPTKVERGRVTRGSSSKLVMCDISCQLRPQSLISNVFSCENWSGQRTKRQRSLILRRDEVTRRGLGSGPLYLGSASPRRTGAHSLANLTRVSFRRGTIEPYYGLNIASSVTRSAAILCLFFLFIPCYVQQSRARESSRLATPQTCDPDSDAEGTYRADTVICGRGS